MSDSRKQSASYQLQLPKDAEKVFSWLESFIQLEKKKIEFLLPENDNKFEIIEKEKKALEDKMQALEIDSKSIPDFLKKIDSDNLKTLLMTPLEKAKPNRQLTDKRAKFIRNLFGFQYQEDEHNFLPGVWKKVYQFLQTELRHQEKSAKILGIFSHSSPE